MHLRLALAALAALAAPAAAQTTLVQNQHEKPVPSATAVEMTAPVVLDGVLNEEVWTTAAPATDFRQHEPKAGEPATQRTEVRFTFDDEALYIGARMRDTLGPAGVRTRLGRRDQGIEGDYLELVFDTFHDHSGRTVFRINPSGVKYDAGQASSYADPSWDPIWRAATKIDSAGWTAEMRIPWSQLRFSRDAAQTWGVQIYRYLERQNELSMWSFWGPSEAGGPQRFGHLDGIRINKRPRGLELMPYAVARASYVRPSQPGSPFQDEAAYDTRVGGDVRMLLGSNLTLSATINPDFGQVEQDPAVVNLSAFESYFEEKRPFFVEGSGLLSFGGLNCFNCSNVEGMSLFYSRRIGRAPQGGLPDGYDFTETPRNTRMLAAAKLTGRTGGGWQLGALEAVTAREVARVQSTDGSRDEVAVEPLSNYALVRARRTTGGGRYTWGLIGTSVVRRFGAGDDRLRERVASHAETVGADWNLYSAGQKYRLMGNVAFSNVQGDSLAIGRLQRSSARYFDRPDRVSGGNGIFSDLYDTSAGEMRGFGGYARASKETGDWLWEAGLNYRSPGFEVNDMAFMNRADYVWMNANLLRQWTKPGSWYRRLTWIGGGQQQHNFDGDRTDLQAATYLGGQFLNYWNWSGYIQYRPGVYDDRATRGAGVVRRPTDWFSFINLSTDSRKPLVLSLNPSMSGNEEGSRAFTASGSARFKPASNVQLTVGPSFTTSRGIAQFVRRFDDPSATDFSGRRAVFAGIEQRTLSVNTRLNWTFTPDLTLELFAQPFVATGDYDRFKEFVRPRELDKREFDAAQLVPTVEDGRVTSYTLDPDRNAATENFTFDNPDFNVRSLRGSAVLRWEYRPGSTLFFVWQQERSGSAAYGDFAFDRDAAAVFRSHPDNIFVIKASYWLGR